ncbi:hypothetical protein HanXRQr2_Chr10g0450881 [Helianthus annuus]|uniref:Uncharacterized protein n=1 Tax=Helianthus annuus TaxID=4232 RepID=A0A251TMW6_HELAN|nr:hypothetical protein HanXRQr2_Chr10g0450881 [Helianthus annuus]
MLGSSHASSLSIIFEVLPRSLAAALTLASLFSITLSWHLTIMTRGMFGRATAMHVKVTIGKLQLLTISKESRD